MDIFEFELRYLAYKWLNTFFELWIQHKDILELVKRTNKWQLIKKLTETTPDELKELTLQTYTTFKKQFIESNKEKKINNYTLAEYLERLEYELKVIKEMWYNTYFLIVWDYINRAKNNKIAVGPGRWSAAWSLLSYLIWITDIDPLLYDLLFERFLNPARISMPDIDTDFEDIQREKIFEYVKQKYWKEKVSSIWTYMTMAAKAAFKDVARVFWIAFDRANKITALITEKTISKSLAANSEFKDLLDSDNDIKKIVDLAIKLEWTIRQTWVHACWVIIAPENVVTYTPVQYPPKIWKGTEEEKYVTQYDWHYLEDIGLLKMDFLWLRNLSIIKDTVKILRAKYKKEGKDLPKIFEKYLNTMSFLPKLDDLQTYEVIFHKWDTSWVFQFESDWMKNWLKSLKPNDINDIIAMVALYRPGPMEFIPHYIARKKWEEKISYLPDDVYDILKSKYSQEVADQERKKITHDLSPFMDITYWIPIYQEQLMRIVQAMAWFSLGEADLLRRWVWKKIKEVIEKLKAEFITKASNLRDYKTETSIYVYEKMIEPAADYSFNKSHAACYALIAYQTAYLKTHYPIEFNAALLRSVEEDTEKLAKFIDELKLSWLKILPPCVNESYAHVAAINDFIRIWFLAIKWVWSEVAQVIEEEREKNWKYKNFEDFIKRCQRIVNKKSIESLAKAWALDWLEDRLTVIKNLDSILDYAKSIWQNANWGWLFDFWAVQSNLAFKNKFQTKLLDKLLLEYEVFKTFISAHPFDWLYKYIKSKYNFISMFKDIEDYWEFKIIWFVKQIRRALNKWFFITIEDISWDIDIFLKEVLDIKEFNILIVKWFKWKSVRIKQAIRIDLEDLIEKWKNSWKYDIEDTVVSVREKRYSAKNKPMMDKYDDLETIERDSIEFIENPENEIALKEDLEEEIEEKTEFELPDNPSIIKTIVQILKEKKWKLSIKIHNNEYFVSQEWLEEIRKILK